MKRKWNLLPAAAMLAAGVLLTGCDTKPQPPRTGWGNKIEFVEINPSNAAILDAASRMEAARQDYDFRLSILQAYYERIGNIDKLRWSTRELENLRDAQTFKWKGLPPIEPPLGEDVQESDERLLVELTVSARSEWKDAVVATREAYEQQGKPLHAELIQSVIERYDPVYVYMYYLDAEIPGPDLKPTRVAPEADQMYERAMDLHEGGKGLLHLKLNPDYDKQRQALTLFKELVRKYPDSTKIALAAYRIAEIYKDYFQENVRAVHWYERAWQWDPDIDQPARFQAATVYDIRMQNKDKAVELYRESMEHDPFRVGNYEYAKSRITDITEEQD